MGVREIPASEWRQFLDLFSRGHRAWLTAIDQRSPGGSWLEVRPERPLSSIVPEVRDERVVGIEIRFQEAVGSHDLVRIDAPVELQVEDTAQGTVRMLEIVDAAGEGVRVRFRAAPAPETLDGIAPGELWGT